ncbi:putative ATPase [Paraburkholderia sp. WSM4175]|uniref:AAA family ATPase n=1 Tax=Paraburkholderia sp. WSM4175 TaxID=2991072 RepID=UPI003D19F249
MALEPKPYLQQVSLRDDLEFDFEAFPLSLPAVRELGTLEFHPDVTFFVGENGSGKSTVVEAIAVALGFGPEGGTKSVQFRTADTVSSLHAMLRLIKSFRKPSDSYFLRAESFYNVATYMDEVDYLKGYGGRSLHKVSHGESFMATISNKLRGNGLYIMDEPESALSPTRQLAALSAIHKLVQDESQFIIATHSPILLAYPRAKIYQFDSSGIYEIDYEDTEHYAITRDFLNHYSKRLGDLLEDH